ncbi:MAG: TonB family protein [Desulfobacterales bacterium]
MSQKRYLENYPDGDNERRKFFSNFAISFFCHLSLFAILMFAPGFATSRTSSLAYINVDLVTMPSENSAPLPAKTKKDSTVGKKAETPKIPVKETPKPVRESSAATSLKPKKIKRSLKKKTFNPESVVKNAISRIKKDVEDSKSDQIKKAIARLEEQVKKTGPMDLDKEGASKGLRGPGDTGANSKQALELIDIYRIEIAYQIQKNWAFSEQLAGGQTDLEAWVAIKIARNGEIKDIWFDKRSGNDYFDEAAKNAIKKSNPLPPLPNGYMRPYCEAGFHFTSSGLGK